jgi:hypothetical protein
MGKNCYLFRISYQLALFRSYGKRFRRRWQRGKRIENVRSLSPSMTNVFYPFDEVDARHKPFSVASLGNKAIKKNPWRLPRVPWM